MNVSISLDDDAINAIAVRIAEILRTAEARRDAGDEPSSEWMGVPGAAQYLGISQERVRKLVARRAVPYVQEGHGHRVFFSRRALDEWMLSHLIPERNAAGAVR